MSHSCDYIANNLHTFFGLSKVQQRWKWIIVERTRIVNLAVPDVYSNNRNIIIKIVIMRPGINDLM